MAEIKLDLINLISYLKENSKISEIEINKVNSIFTQCDTICEDGTQGADGKLTKDEVRTFFELIMQASSNIGKQVKSFVDTLMNDNVQQAHSQPMQTKPVKFTEE